MSGEQRGQKIGMPAAFFVLANQVYWLREPNDPDILFSMIGWLQLKSNPRPLQIDWYYDIVINHNRMADTFRPKLSLSPKAGFTYKGLRTKVPIQFAVEQGTELFDD